MRGKCIAFTIVVVALLFAIPVATDAHEPQQNCGGYGCHPAVPAPMMMVSPRVFPFRWLGPRVTYIYPLRPVMVQPPPVLMYVPY